MAANLSRTACRFCDIRITGAWSAATFRLDEIEAAYDLFGHQRDGVLKVAITP
jgi:threonine dehydrogenase-like Zn-dependent dehydrogenase